MTEELETVRGTSDPFADRDDPMAASKAAKARLATEIIRVLRERDLSTVEAAELAHIGRSQISRIKNARLANISLDTLVNVLDALSKENHVVLRVDYAPRQSGMSLSLG